VKVANGAKIMSARRCHFIALRVQGKTFITNLCVLTLGGYDDVLGIEWLRTLGPILWDFKLLAMQFQFGDYTISFNGLNPTGLSLEEGHQFSEGIYI
jgi:hypothetical protein